MQVSEAIGNEVVFFLLSVLEGIGLVFVYDGIRIVRRIIPHRNLGIGIEDILYWLFCTAAVFLLLYQKNDGMMRAFMFLGIVLGMGVYYLLFSRIVIRICVWFFGGIVKILQRICGFLFTPIRKVGKKLLHFLKKQLKKIGKAIKMGLCKL